MRTKEEREKDREERKKEWGDRVDKWRGRIQNARKGPLRPMDENDVVAANFVIETLKNARADGEWSMEDIDTSIDALQAWRDARKDTP